MQTYKCKLFSALRNNSLLGTKTGELVKRQDSQGVLADLGIIATSEEDTSD